MIRWLRDAFSTGASDEMVDAEVRRGMDDVLAALDNVIDDEAVLTRIYVRLGKDVTGPAPTTGQGTRTAADEMCARIGMLESAITTVVKAGPSASFLGTVSLNTARRYLYELRNGLQNRTMTAPEAFRLLTSTRHALHEADTVLRRQHDMPLRQPVHAQIGDLRQLSTDLLGQLEDITEGVMRLFGHSDDSAPILVPQH
jgi:hypothetical protein